MKTILFILLASTVIVGAQAPPSPPPTPAPPAPGVAPAPNPVTPAPDPAAAPSSVTPAPAASPEEETIPPGHINWTAADLTQVLQTYSDLVGRTILRPAGLQAAAAFVFKNQTALTKTEFIQALDALLALNGIAVIHVGEKFMKVVPVDQANTAGQKINELDAKLLPEMGQYVTHIVQLKYAKPSEMTAVLQPFQKLPNAVLAVESTQMLILRDYAENVKRMLEMIDRVDVTVPSEFISEVIPIKFAKVADIASALNSLGGGGGTTSVGGHSGSTTRGATGSSTGTRTGFPGQTGYNPGGMNTPGSVGAQTGTPSSGASFSDRIQQIIRKASSSSGSGDLQIIGTTKIVADERSNSLLIFATRQDMTMIKDIISKLDVVLAQVIIETVIMEVDVTDGWNFGVSGLEKPHSIGTYFTGVGGLNNVGFLSPNNFASVASNSAAALGQGFSYFGTFGNDLDVTLTAAAQDSTVTIIQKPRVQTSHATPASIFIGNTVPYISGTYYGYGGSTPSSSYQQLQVGIGLNVTPFINADGLVVMQIDETIDELGPSVKIDGNDVPQTKHRTLTAEVAVRDRETVILGGFIRDQDEKSKSGVPILKDIPILSYLFSSTRKSKERKELIVLMRPTVLRTPELAAAYTTEEKARLPGIREAEAQNEMYEKKRIRETERRMEKKSKTYSKPPVSTIETSPGQSNMVSSAKSPPPAVKSEGSNSTKTAAKSAPDLNGRDSNGFLVVPQ